MKTKAVLAAFVVATLIVEALLITSARMAFGAGLQLAVFLAVKPMMNWPTWWHAVAGAMVPSLIYVVLIRAVPDTTLGLVLLAAVALMSVAAGWWWRQRKTDRDGAVEAPSS